jgi:hypothetical protein
MPVQNMRTEGPLRSEGHGTEHAASARRLAFANVRKDRELFDGPRAIRTEVVGSAADIMSRIIGGRIGEALGHR